MSTRSSPPRLPGDSDELTIGGRVVPYETGELPEDFVQRLHLLKKRTGLTWGEMARRLGTNTLTLRRWRAGTRPNALHLLALLDLAEELKLAHLLPKGTFHRR